MASPEYGRLVLDGETLADAGSIESRWYSRPSQRRPSLARTTTQNGTSIARPVGAISPAGAASGPVCAPRATTSANACSPPSTSRRTSCVRSGKAAHLAVGVTESECRASALRAAVRCQPEHSAAGAAANRPSRPGES
jgi:hypothetical protein